MIKVLLLFLCTINVLNAEVVKLDSTKNLLLKKISLWERKFSCHSSSQSRKAINWPWAWDKPKLRQYEAPWFCLFINNLMQSLYFFNIWIELSVEQSSTTITSMFL